MQTNFANHQILENKMFGGGAWWGRSKKAAHASERFRPMKQEVKQKLECRAMSSAKLSNSWNSSVQDLDNVP